MADWLPDLSQAAGPRYLALADRIAADIRSGRLAAGDRLPPQRTLARHLSLNFTTVARGYGEAQSRGLIESRVGHGTIVRGIRRPDRDVRAEVVDLSMNLPPEPSDPELLGCMREGLAELSRDLVSLLRYQECGGTRRDKDAASAWLSRRALVPSQERIIVAPGAHAAIQAILSLLCNPGDRVLCEAITYPGVKSIAAQLGLDLVGISLDDDGIEPDAFAEACEVRTPKALYLNPTLQNPLTTTISAQRREAIVAVARRYGVPILEDDAYGFIPPHGAHPIASIAPDITWHIAGLAKCIGAGLRAAYVVAPNARAAWPIVTALRAANVMASPLTVALATRWIEDGTADSILRFIRAEAGERQKLAATLLAAHRYRGAALAFNIWIELPDGWTRSAFIGHMRTMRIGIVPSDAFVVGCEPGERVRVCLGGPVSRARLHDALDFMGHALETRPSVAQSYI